MSQILVSKIMLSFSTTPVVIDPPGGGPIVWTAEDGITTAPVEGDPSSLIVDFTGAETVIAGEVSCSKTGVGGATVAISYDPSTGNLTVTQG